jgi:hypothetical protein
MAAPHEIYRGYSIEQLLQALEVAGEAGSARRCYLENLISVRTAETVNKQLAGTAESIGKSATLLKDTLENSSAFLINAIKVSTEDGTKNAQQIGEQITHLTGAMTMASSELQSAGAQSAALGRRLNWLTGILMVAALISATATAFYAYETKRQVELMEQQLQRVPTTQQPSPTAVTPAPPVLIRRRRKAVDLGASVARRDGRFVVTIVDGQLCLAEEKAVG